MQTSQSLPPQAFTGGGSPLAGGPPLKCRSLPLLDSPGPADYRPVRQYPDSPKGSFTQARRWDGHTQQAVHTPGPGHYTGSGASPLVFTSMPGQPRFSSVPRISLGDASNMPGPTDYKPAVQTRLSPQGSFGRSQRWTGERHINPGPSDYRKTFSELNRLMRSARQPAFSTAARNTMVRKSITGPPHPSSLKLSSGAGAPPAGTLQKSFSAPVLISSFSRSPSMGSLPQSASTPHLAQPGMNFGFGVDQAELSLDA